MRTKTLFLSLAALALSACEPLPFWPKSDGYVTGTLSAATLADDCGAVGASAPRQESDCAGECRLACRPSSIQLSFRSASRSTSKVTIRAVRAVNLTTNVVSTFTHSDPRQWQNSAYVSWNEQLPAGAVLQVTYTIRQVPVSTLPAAAGLRAPDTYRVEVDVELGGVVRTLTIDAQREPDVVT